jgi:hypothetical protein
MTITIDAPRHTNGAHAERKVAPFSPALRYQLEPETETGRKLVALAEELAAEFSMRAADHDREATYPFEAIDELKARGYFAAQVPGQFGGLSVGSVAAGAVLTMPAVLMVEGREAYASMSSDAVLCLVLLGLSPQASPTRHVSGLSASRGRSRPRWSPTSFPPSACSCRGLSSANSRAWARSPAPRSSWPV